MSECPASSCTSCNGIPRFTSTVIRVTLNLCGWLPVTPDFFPSVLTICSILSFVTRLSGFLRLTNNAGLLSVLVSRYFFKYIAALSVKYEILSLSPFPCKRTLFCSKSTSSMLTFATSDTRAAVAYINSNSARSLSDLQHCASISISLSYNSRSFFVSFLIRATLRAGLL